MKQKGGFTFSFYQRKITCKGATWTEVKLAIWNIPLYIEENYAHTVVDHIQSVFKKRPNFCSFYSILSTVPFKVVPSTGDALFPTFLPLLDCFLERTFRDGAQFS